MPSLRRFVRITVIRPHDELDLTVAHDADPSEVLRLCVTGDLDPAVADGGWVLAHPVLGDLTDTSEAMSVLQDGDVIHLRARAEHDVRAPVDDVAEHTRHLVGQPGDVVGTALVAVGVLLAPAAAVVTHLLEKDAGVLIGLGVLVPLAWLLRDRATGPVAGSAFVALAGIAAGTATWRLRSDVPLALLVATLGAFAAAGIAWFLTEAGRWRQVMTACGGAGLLLAATAVAWAVIGTRATVVPAVGAVLLSWWASRIVLATSGLGAVDAAVAAGEFVPGDVADALVGRASAELTALCWVSALAVLAGAAWAGTLGTAGLGLGAATGIVVAARARLLVRPRHGVPLVVGGALAVAVGAMVPIASYDARAVPVLVVAVAVLVVAVSGARRQPGSVGVSRARRVVDRLDRVAVLTVPLWVAGVFDLYRFVWGAF
ncbi:MAG: hypothetical protein Q4G43_04855 [Mobilicoccus sp.]|nr:hypothetical protein [Mobilicoccus sp.]